MAVVTTIAMHKSCIRGTLCQWRVCYVFYGNDVRHYVMPSASNSKQFLLSNEIINFPYHSLYVFFWIAYNISLTSLVVCKRAFYYLTKTIFGSAIPGVRQCAAIHVVHLPFGKGENTIIYIRNKPNPNPIPNPKKDIFNHAWPCIMLFARWTRGMADPRNGGPLPTQDVNDVINFSDVNNNKIYQTTLLTYHTFKIISFYVGLCVCEELIIIKTLFYFTRPTFSTLP